MCLSFVGGMLKIDDMKIFLNETKITSTTAYLSKTVSIN